VKKSRRELHEKTVDFWRQREEARLKPLDYRDLPRRPSSRPVAHLLCSYVSFRDALFAWSEQDPEARGSLTSEALFEHAKAEKKRCAKAIAEALGPHDNFGAAREAIEKWRTEARSRAGFVTRNDRLQAKDVPIMVPVWEINTTVQWLLEAYENPLRFFRETAPRLYPKDFTFRTDWTGVPKAIWDGKPDEEPPEDALKSAEREEAPDLDWSRLRSTFQEWGGRAHLNPSFQEAFVAAAAECPWMFVAHVIGPAENLEKFRPPHRQKGSGDGPDSTRRQNEASGELSLFAEKMLTEDVSDADYEDARRRLQRYPDLLAEIEKIGDSGKPADDADALVASFGPFAGLARSTVKKWRLVATKK
jgi:hypothetical protein